MARSIALMGAATVGNTILGVATITINPTCNAAEVTGMDSDGDAVFLPGVRRYDISIDGFHESTGEPPAVDNNAVVAWTAKSSTSSALVSLAGSCVITGAPLTLEVDGGVAFSLTAQGTGALTKTAGYETSLS